MRAPGGDILEFWIDVGGTFTDCVARCSDGTLRTHKLLSTGVYRGRVGRGSTRSTILDERRQTDPPGYFEGFDLSISQVVGPGGGGSYVWRSRVRHFENGRLELDPLLPADPPVDAVYELAASQPAPILGMRWLAGLRLADPVGRVRVRLGTTRGTNALLERKGANVAFVTTAGLGDLLEIGDQSRPRLFDLNIRRPTPLHRQVIEVHERIDAAGNVLEPLDAVGLERELQEARQSGVESLAVCLLNSYRNAVHEEQVALLAAKLGFRQVCLSSRLADVQGMLLRAETTVIDAYLGPVVQDYIGELLKAAPDADVRLMTSAGSLVRAQDFVARDSVLSGPAGGVVGVALTARRAGESRAIGFDMGGTSTDVSRFDGQLERRYSSRIVDRETGGSMRLAAPMLAIETVAAGGGSICGFDGVRPRVGPASAGADPGPACYGRGGPLCITDCNLLLGRLAAENFPFPLDVSAAEVRLAELREAMRSATGRDYDAAELAAGYVAIANAHMAAGIRAVSTRQGVDPAAYALVSFGGAGAQHACAIARELGMRRVLLPARAGVLSAVGIGHADVSRFAERAVGRELTSGPDSEVRSWFDGMERQFGRQLIGEGFAASDIGAPMRSLDLRYRGQETALTVDEPGDCDWVLAFTAAHRRLYGFVLRDREIEIHVARVRMTARSGGEADLPTDSKPIRTTLTAAEAIRSVQAVFDGRRVSTPVYLRDSLGHRASVAGPALVLEPTSTIVVEPGWLLETNAGGELVMNWTAGDGGQVPVDEGMAAACDPVQLELFHNRFTAIAEEMGDTLQRTALSTNVKERLDYSCAIVDARGGLVSHAAHIPVHIGAMSQCVVCLMEELAGAGGVRPGAVYVSNDPFRGGSHLPDITVMTPVFDGLKGDLLFWTASRAHHAEIGGIVPGSMPPISCCLADEGVLIRAMRVGVSGQGAIDDDELRRALSSGPFPSRAVEQNIADLHAQIAANHRGAVLLNELVGRHGEGVVQAYMTHIQQAAAAKMRSALRGISNGVYQFRDELDDGWPIAVTLTVRDGEAVVDFSGTGPVHPGNFNATPAIVVSAVLYCLRCLIQDDIPLNAGVLEPVRIVIPPGLLDSPSNPDATLCPAVAAGNVETSQRIVDVVLGALGVAAASQGTMNNLAFGDDQFGYYETIGGGAGAGPTWDGASAVHTHMTNTRLTDPEVLEARYPVRLRRFSVRRGSRGAGARFGGDGIVREIAFLAPLNVSLVTQRRGRAPFGLKGGNAASAGRNLLMRKTVVETGAIDDRTEVLPAAWNGDVGAGDVIRIETPGGGGFGHPVARRDTLQEHSGSFRRPDRTILSCSMR